MINDITNGRRRGCGACGVSESYELMQLASIQPHDSGIIDILDVVHGEGNDIPVLLQLDNCLAEI